MDAADFLHAHCATDHGGDSPHLPGWGRDDWDALLAGAQPVQLDGGEVLVRGGQDERCLYFVLSGCLEVNARGRGETFGELFHERPGAVFGEISFFDGLPRTATVWAAEPTELLRVAPDHVREFTRARPERGNELLFALGRVLAFRLRRDEGRSPGGLGRAGM